MATVTVGDAKARAEGDRVRVQDALADAEEANRKLEVEIGCLEVERTSLLLEIRATRDEMPYLHSQAGRDKEAIEEDY